MRKVQTEVEITFSESIHPQAAYQAIAERAEEAMMSGFPAFFYLGEESIPAGELESVSITGDGDTKPFRVTCVVTLLETPPGKILTEVKHFRLSASFNGKPSEESITYLGMNAILNATKER